MKRVLKIIATGVGVLAVIVMALAVGFALVPVSSVETTPQDVASVDAAIAEIDRWQQDEAEFDGMNPECASRFINADGRADRAVVLFHGFTNCPAQWSQFADSLAAEGWAVVIPRMPGHGLSSDAGLAAVSAEELAQTIDRSVAIASGLADDVTLVGLSSGGVFAAWAGTQTDVDLVVSIAPAFTLNAVPAWASGVVERTARLIPNVWLWWDGSLKQELEGPDYAYKRYSTHAYGQIGRLGQITVRRDPVAQPGRFVFLLNPEDPAVNNDVPEHLAAAWAAQGWDATISYFPADGLPHDVVDPHQPGARIEESYPIILETLQRDEGA